MKISQHFSLQKFNTFGINAIAGNFAVIRSVEEAREAFKNGLTPLHILGGGSNILLTGDIQGFVLKNEIGGISIAEEHPGYANVAVGGGVNWHELVLWCIEKNLAGIENLSLIPGTVGAAPIQNIGAYGVELKDVFLKLEAIEISTGKLKIFHHEDCRFGYRNSIFKKELKGKLLITKVFLRLSKDARINTTYGDIQRTLSETGIEKPDVRDVSNAVIHIRQSKLPDPAEIGNAGSFFKNPEVSKSQADALKTQYPDMVQYELPNGLVKVPAGWLIERAGWKGKRFGDAGCHARQALVLVNYGNATGKEIYELALKIQASIQQQFGIHLNPEVNLW